MRQEVGVTCQLRTEDSEGSESDVLEGVLWFEQLGSDISLLIWDTGGHRLTWPRGGQRVHAPV